VRSTSPPNSWRMPHRIRPLGRALRCRPASIASTAASGGTPSGLILCGMRHEFGGEVERTADLALRYASQGVVGFDLAGPEAGFPPARHAATLARVHAAGLPITLHAGEADVAERVLEAAEHGAVRIGHGVRLADALHDPARAGLLEAVRQRGLHLEVCPTSNVHTGAFAALAEHPLAALWRAGIECSFHTDNRLMSVVGLADEAVNVLQGCGVTLAEMLAMTRAAAQRSFLPEAARQDALAQIEAWGQRQALATV
jgi:adenosine deaminase